MLACLIVAFVSQTAGESLLTPSTGPILSSLRIKPGTYTLTDMNGSGAVQIGADGVTIDFQGSTIQSPSAWTGRFETFNGIGISVNGHKNVTIRRARVHGFQYNIKALNCQGLKLEDCELSESRSQRILDGQHANQIWLDLRGLDSWRNYGAGAWLEECIDSSILGLRANQSQNGLILVKSNRCKIVGCDFSYNSGWGIALCRSSDNLICWNHADFVNRPWGGGWGGDSSGVVLTTSSHRNTWAFNSFTHGGDGFFLATLNGGFDDQGKLHDEGPCDGNWVVQNDGSWATANAFESTFSEKNVFYKNICNDSNYGFWLGYSTRNIISGNQIKRSHVDGIAHEQGSKCVYIENDIEDTGETAIHLWGGSDPKFTQSPSTKNYFLANKIKNARKGFDLTNSTDYKAQGNVVRNAPIPLDFHEVVVDTLTPGDTQVPRLSEILSLKPLGFKMYRDTDLPKGWQWLAASDYGMRDYRNMPVPWDMKDARTLRLFIRPGYSDRIELTDWMTKSKGDGSNEWLVTPKPSSSTVGSFRAFKLPVTITSNKKEWIVGQLLDLKWHIRWFKWFRNEHTVYKDSAAWKSLFDGPALKEEDLSDLPDIPGYRAPEPGLPSDHFALTGTTKISLAKGNYRFDTVSDDGIQVLVDGRTVIDNWTHHGATSDTGQIALSSGVHGIEVHYCQEDGGAALSVKIQALGVAP